MRRIGYWLGLVAASLAVGSGAYAQTLTLSLEEPTLSQSAQKPDVKAVEKKQPLPKQVTVKVGRVGLVSVSSAPIYKSKSARSAKFTTVGSETPLAVIRDEDGWYGVLMANGAIGWLPCKNVKLTGYELVSKNSPSTNPTGKTTAKKLPGTGDWADDLIKTAVNYTGVRYVFGGTDPDSGMDCSAFVRMIFGQYSIPLPRTAREQAQVGTTVPFDQLQPGDRLYFSCKNPYVDHCGIYAGNGYFVHCSSSKHGVSLDSLASSFYWRSLVVAKRS